MQRNLNKTADEQFDVAIIGGGAFGAAAARDAALRGLKTLLVERSDFGAGASAECFKMVHGGIRYLQHRDVRRLRASCAERSALLRTAPHLVSPLPIVIPTYGHGRRGKALLRAGTFVYDALTRDRNQGISDPARHIDNCHFLSRSEVLALFPDIDARGLTGAAVFSDGQMYNPARLVLAYVKSAAQAGATVVNYAEVIDFLWQGTAVSGLVVRDRIDGTKVEIRAGLVLNAAGPWAESLLECSPRLRASQEPRGVYSRDAYITIARRPTSKYALALEGRTRDHDAKFSRSARHMFMVPWRDHTLLGVWHRVFKDSPELARVDREEIREWLEEFNWIYPALDLSPQDVSFANCGLVPFGDKALAGQELSFGKESRFIDHRLHGASGIVTVIGIRFTTARGDAAHALDVLLQQHPMPPSRAATERLALAGGAIEDFNSFVAQAHREYGQRVGAASLEALLRNFGTEYRSVLLGPTTPIAQSTTLSAEVLYAVSREWAVRLEDVILRRTDLGTGRHPGAQALEEAASHMAQLLGWPEQRRRVEIHDCEQTLKAHRAFTAHDIPPQGAATVPVTVPEVRVAL